MARASWGMAGLFLCILCGCSSSEATFGSATSPTSVVKMIELPKATGEGKLARAKGLARSLTHSDLLRIFVEEPAADTSPLLEAHQDITFLSRLSPKEQVLYAELTHQ